MWYKAKCLRECIFRGVRRKPGQIYEGPVLPSDHFEIISKEEDNSAAGNAVRVCPFCGCDLNAGNDKDCVTIERSEYQELMDMVKAVKVEQDADDDESCEECIADEEDGEPSKIPYSKLKRMSYSKLLDYGESIGIVMEETTTKDVLLQTIYQHQEG